jgi:WD40 repeat protein
MTLGMDGNPEAITFSPDGKVLAAALGGELVRFWQVDTLQLLGEVRERLRSVAFSADGKTWAESGDGIRLREWVSGKVLRAFPEHDYQASWQLTFAPDGSKLACLCGAGVPLLRVVDVATGEELNPFPGHRAAVCASSLAGQFLATAGRDGTVCVWDREGRQITRFAGHPVRLTEVALSGDGKLVATGDAANTVLVREVATGKEVLRFQGPAFRGKRTFRTEVLSLSFSLDGRRLMAASTDGNVRLWELTGGSVRPPRMDETEGGVASLSPDGRLITSGSKYPPFFGKSSLRVWEPGTGKVRLEIEGEREEVFGLVAWSPDGKLLAVWRAIQGRSRGGLYGHRIDVWEVATGRRALRLGVDEEVLALAFAADGRTLASVGGMRYFAAGSDVVLWDLARGARAGRLSAVPSGITTLSFAPDGKTLFTGCADGCVLAWDVPRPRAFRGRPPPLSPAEREQLWEALADVDASRAFAAIWRLVGSPGPALSLLGGRLRAVPPADPARTAWLIAALDSRRFAERETALRELEAQGEQIEGALRSVLAGRPSLEVRRRVEGLLAKLERHPPPTDSLRALRATTVLEQIGTSEARQLLNRLAAGAPGALLTKQARQSLRRLE